MANKLLVITAVVIHAFVVIWGALYSYPLWIPKLKETFGLSQAEVEYAQCVAGLTISCSDVGAMIYVGSACVGMPLAALLSDRFGLSISTAVGVVAAPLGYLLIWALTAKQIASHVPLLYFAVLVLGFSTGVSFICLMGLLFMRANSPRIQWVLNGTVNLFYAVGGMLFSLAFNGKWFGAFDSTILSIAVVHTVTVPVVLFLAWYANPNREVDGEEKPLLANAADGQNAPAPSPSTPRVLTGREAARVLFQSRDFWLVCALCFFIVGVGSSFTANLGSFTKAIDGEGATDRSDYITSIFNACQLVGRLLVVLVCGLFTEKLGPAKLTTLLVTAIALTFAGVTVFAAVDANSSTLVPITVLNAISYGAMWPVIPMLVQLSPLTQPEYFQIVSGLSQPFGGGGAVLLNYLVGRLYDVKAEPGTHDCYYSKHNCFGHSFALLSTCAGLAVVLVWVYSNKKQPPETAAHLQAVAEP